MPTEAEIAEGAAKLASERNPSDAELYTQWCRLAFALSKYVQPCTTRCPKCRTLRFGRSIEIACAVCATMRGVGE